MLLTLNFNLKITKLKLFIEMGCICSKCCPEKEGKQKRGRGRERGRERERESGRSALWKWDRKLEKHHPTIKERDYKNADTFEFLNHRETILRKKG